MRQSGLVRRMGLAAGLGVGTAGALAGVLLLGPVAASILLAAVFVLVWPLAAVVRHVTDDAPYGSAGLVAATAAAAVLALPGLVRLLAWGGLGVTAALVLAALFVLIDLAVPDRPPRRATRKQRKLERLTEAQLADDEQLIASLKCPLSIEELCGVWSETVTQLAHDAGLRDRQAVAEVRRICLDEFEKRNPDGFHRWLDAGAPANPSRYLLPTPGEGPTRL
ncbi:hypothetical protein [Kribbella sp. NPDC004875]|uniref:hypothetical protein n=1 Tax=Kribbella sp. NPDC004875 TaxID=3364107 RepID=UPI00367F8E8A